MYWSFSWARILNVQDIIKERSKERSSSIFLTCIPSTTIAGAGHPVIGWQSENDYIWRLQDGAGQLSFNTRLRCTSYRGCRPTHQIPVHCWSSPPLIQWRSIVSDAGLTLIHHWVCSIVYFEQTRDIPPVLFQCWHTVFDTGPSLKQHWVIVPSFLTAALCRCHFHPGARSTRWHEAWCCCNAGPPSAWSSCDSRPTYCCCMSVCL